jgi:HTH-type transcriptional regulator/antitoxin HigA
MELKPIQTEEEYEAALQEIERLFNAEPDSPEEQKMEVLAILVDLYEKEHYSIPLPDPIEAIQFHMERLGLRNKDMVPYFGSPSRVSEILNRKRSLTLGMIRNLNKGLGIPLDVLVQEYDLEALTPAPLASILFGELANPAEVYMVEPSTKDSATSEGLPPFKWSDSERIKAL